MLDSLREIICYAVKNTFLFLVIASQILCFLDNFQLIKHSSDKLKFD